ncbi:MAG: DNA mismatch repair endonuclease MutL [Planctomycetota bacterium]
MIERARDQTREGRFVRVLDAHIANKIAAGEVIERPASVVKELVENAIDAHATRIEVIVEEGGKRLLRITDDGWGIGPDDLTRVFLPHATSKLNDVDDLDRIATLGFRGEALASIGSVAHVRLRSRQPGSEGGFEIENNGGDLSDVRAAGTAPGTEIVVRNLFFNTPARARFLRADRTELGHIEERVRQMALAFPEIGFRLQAGGRELIRTEPGEDRRARLESIYGRAKTERLIACPVELRMGESPIGRLHAFLGPPDLARPNARDLRFFVNGRAVQDRILMRVVRDAYRDVMHHGRYPLAFLFFDLDPTAIDVNVHPTKAEIRWRDARFLHAAVTPALARALRAEDLSAAMDQRTPEARQEGVREALKDFLTRADEPRIAERLPAVERPPAFSIMQMHDSYLVCEVEDGIAIVDQHALHERVNYDRILHALEAGGVDSQRLLVPEQVELDATALGLLDEHRALVERAGFRWSPFGETEIALEAVPAVLSREGAGEVVRDIVELLRRRGAAVDAKTVFHDVADTMACKASIRFGDRISREEAHALLEESGALDHAFVCPHGRPTVLRLPFAQLEKHFGRR